MKRWDDSAHDSANARESEWEKCPSCGQRRRPRTRGIRRYPRCWEAIGWAIGKHRRSVSEGIGQIGVCSFPRRAKMRPILKCWFQRGGPVKPLSFAWCGWPVGADLRAARHGPSFRTARPEVGPYRRESPTRNRQASARQLQSRHAVLPPRHFCNYGKPLTFRRFLTILHPMATIRKCHGTTTSVPRPAAADSTRGTALRHGGRP